MWHYKKRNSYGITRIHIQIQDENDGSQSSQIKLSKKIIKLNSKSIRFMGEISENLVKVENLGETEDIMIHFCDM